MKLLQHNIWVSNRSRLKSLVAASAWILRYSPRKIDSFSTDLRNSEGNNLYENYDIDQIKTNYVIKFVKNIHYPTTLHSRVIGDVRFLEHLQYLAC